MAAGELCRVIIADDEILIRQGIKHYINWEQEGFQIVGEASNGQEVLELIERTNPHIIMTDIVMPIMDGEELTRIVKDKYPHIEMIILSSFGEFNYVRSAFQSGVVDYILKPKLDAQGLLKVLQTAASRIPSFQPLDKNLDVKLSIGEIINKLISGYEVNYDSASITKAFPYEEYCLLGVDLKAHPSKANPEFPTYITEEIGKALDEHVSQSVHFSFTLDQDVTGFLINANSIEIPQVTTVAKQIVKSEPGIGLALSEEFSDFTQIGKIYKESILKLLPYRFYFPEIPLLMEKDMTEVPKCDNFNLDWFTGEFKRKHFESAFRYLQEHVTALSRCYQTDVYEYKAFFGNIIFNITILLGNMDYDVAELENAKYSYFKSIDQTHTAGEAVEQLNRFIAEANKCIFSMQSQPENLNMKKLMEYIMDHYAESLTLTDVAKHFHFNPSYLSSYFSAHNNEGFIEYLNKIRIEEATKLLISGKVSISEISGMVGYSDHSYFCKVFKKIKGLSPSQYKRKQNLR